MGNEQSNERQPNWKIFKITRKQKESQFVRLHLNDYVTYKDGNYKYFDIDFDKNPWTTIVTLGSFGSLEEGRYARIDLNKTRERCHTYSFELNAIKLVEERVVERKDSNGNIIMETIDLISSAGEILDQRQRFVASIEQSRYANNHAWTKQTSWDMPPGWK